MAGEALDIFISYSHRDEGLKDELVNYHLKPLQRDGKIRTWQDRDIEAGAEWAEEIRTNLENADIVLLLITRHFLASDYCYETEMQRAVQRHHEGTARVIAIILKPCIWQESPFSKLQVLPKDGKAVTTWDNQDEAFVYVEKGIRRVVDALNTERRQAAERARAEAERQRQQQAEQLRQQQAAAEQLERERQAAAQRQRDAAERLQREADAERQRQQQVTERQEQERQRRAAAEQQKQQQAEAVRQARERQRQLAEEQQRQRKAATNEQPGPTGLSRRRVLQIAVPIGGGLFLAVGANSLLKPTQDNRPDKPITSADLSPVEFEVVTVNETGEISNRQTKQADEYREDLGDGVTLNMIAIPAGEFVMGSPPEEEGRNDDEGPQRTVTVPAFFMSRFAITQAQWQAVTAMPQMQRELNSDPSRFKGVMRPVEQVSWDDAVEFCQRLSRYTNRHYRLPSEAEWEYACRAGTTTPFHFGPTITTDLANYRGTDWEYEGKTYPGNYGQGPKGIFREETTDVGSFPPNAFGLYDMHGNVWEWCQDVWHDNYDGAPTDGSAWMEGGDQSLRLLRGGSWGNIPGICRSAYRGRIPRVGGNYYLGFRVVCSSSWAL
jgi:formylglycine-generating enzyme required for sulfatase activity